ncbi:MAG TPA: hypothetical protein VLJ21_03440 [Candidatus Binatia bacterium]|nr:hypothetical protein [Candidatus Binatia bacterium]
MHETTLLKIALGCVLLGLPALYIISEILPPQNTDARDTVQGTVLASHASEKVTRLTVLMPQQVLIFDNVPIPEGKHVRAKGHLDNGTLIADEVRVG